MKRLNWLLVPIDFSADSRHALDAADAQAKRWGSGLILLHVKKPTDSPRTMTKMVIEEEAIQRWAERVKRTPQDRLAVLTCSGEPVDEILRIAAQYQVRKIIMGRGGDARQAGSTAQSVGARFPGLVEALSAKQDDVFFHATLKRGAAAALILTLGWGMVGAMGWKGTPEPKTTTAIDQPYAVSQEKPFSGKVLRIDPPPCATLPLYSYHVHVQLAKEVVEVHMGPCEYVETLKPALQVGDEITGVGVDANWTSGSRRVINAREIRHGKNVMRLRDARGKPLWKIPL